MEDEVWKDIEGYENIYRISNYGRILSFTRKTPRILKKRIDHNGYIVADLYKNKKIQSLKVHRLVAQHFILNKQNKPYVHHKDHNPANNYYKNLTWATLQEHKVHSAFYHHKGEANGNVKLTWDDVNHIKRLLQKGHHAMKIAEMFYVSVSAINMIKYKRNWVYDKKPSQIS